MTGGPGVAVLWGAGALLAFVVGSVNPATIFARLLRKDLSGTGSGNPGATNAGRVLGVRWGVVVAVLDILKGFLPTYLALRVVPALTSADDVLALKPDGVFLSNGPGDPEPLETQVGNIRNLVGKVPIFGICLGHQLLGLAFGGKTYKLKFGHRGANHPVLNQVTQRVEITSHNHGFAVDRDSLNPADVELTHVNLNDETLEGFRHRREPVFCVQYHPEAAPGPHDSHYLFDDFVKLMADQRPQGR